MSTAKQAAAVASLASEATFKLELINRPLTAIENFSPILRSNNTANSFVNYTSSLIRIS
jgi:hypothetical protein